MSRKATRIITVVVLLLVLGLVLALWWGYRQLYHPDPALQQEISEQFGAEFFTSFDPAEHGEEAAQLSEITRRLQADLAGEEDAKQEISSGGEGHAPSNTPSAAEVVKPYLPRFNALENLARQRLDALMAAGLQEYRSQQQQGKVNKTQLARKYLQAADLLESNVDRNFYALIRELEAELKQNNLPTAVIAQAEADYESMKEAQRQALKKRLQDQR